MKKISRLFNIIFIIDISYINEIFGLKEELDFEYFFLIGWFVINVSLCKFYNMCYYI